jgi:hypothetical protein
VCCKWVVDCCRTTCLACLRVLELVKYM